MNNMTKKVIKDGSETRRARMNMVSSIIGGILLLMGAMCLFIKAHSVEYIDAQGFLHENFYLLPIGWLFSFCGALIIIITALCFVIRKISELRRDRNI